jgi:hypothetical protein
LAKHAYLTRLFRDTSFVWSVWLTNWRFWALSPLLLVAGIWVIGTLWSTPANWVERICAATGQDKRAAAWCARHGHLYVHGTCGASPAVLVAAVVLLCGVGAMAIVMGLAGVE